MPRQRSYALPHRIHDVLQRRHFYAVAYALRDARRQLGEAGSLDELLLFDANILPLIASALASTNHGFDSERFVETVKHGELARPSRR